MKSKYVLILAIIAAIVTTVLFRQYIVNMDNKYKAANKIISYIVPKVDIKAGQKVTKDMLELKELSSGSVHPQALMKTSDVEGKYAKVDIQAGETLLAFRFSDLINEKQDITMKINDGYRAVSIGVNDISSVTKMIQPEDYVDVVYTINSQTTIILENIRVLAVGKALVESTTTTDDKGNQTAPDYGTITLELSPADIVKIINSDETGSIKFVLRGKLAP